MKKSSSSLIISILSTSSFLIHMLFSFAVIFVVAYFFGFEILTDVLAGNDSLNSLTYIVYYDKYFPKIPLWFPYQGGGVSTTLGYPHLYTFAVILLKRLTGLTYSSSMGILNFASVVISAWGVYLFVSSRLKTKTAALLAGIFYLFSPMVYVWIWGAGFLAQTFSVIFVPFYLIFFDWFLESVFKGKTNIFPLFLLSIVATLAFLTHPATLMGLLAFSGFYTLGRFLLGKEDSFKIRALAGVKTLILSSVFIFGLSSFWFLPLRSYLDFANRDLVAFFDPTAFAWTEVKGVLGLYDKGSGYPYSDFSIFPPIWILVIVGAFLGLFWERKVTVLGLLALLGIYIGGSRAIIALFAKFAFFLAPFLDIRSWFPLTVVLNPIAAAMAAVLIARLLLLPLFLLKLEKITLPLRFFIKNFRGLTHSLACLLIAALAIYILTPVAGYYDSKKAWILPLGPTIAGINLNGVWNRIYEERCDIKDPTHPKWSRLCSLPYYSDYFELNTLFALCDYYPKEKEKPIVCIGEKKGFVPVKEKVETLPLEREDIEAYVNKECNEKGQKPPYLYPYYSLCLARGKSLKEQLLRWPIPEFTYGAEDFYYLSSKFTAPSELEEIILNENHRIDVSPHLGSSVKSWYIFNKSSMLNAYTGQLTLNKTFYSIFNDNFYGDRKTTPQILNNLGEYFGVEAVVLNASRSPMEEFEKAGWSRIGGETSILTPHFSGGLVSIGKVPRVLVIADKKLSSYKQVFRSANFGSLPLAAGILIEGKERVGDYSLEELKGYDLLILQGYKYRNRQRDLDKLAEYISQGGSVFIDSGWQFVSPDWGRDKEGSSFSTELPLPFPVEKTIWGGVGKDWRDANLNPEFSTGVSLGSFGPLEWEGVEWSVASAKGTRDWAEPILSKGGNILMAAGNLGNGKIVWSGMNIIAHAEDKESQEEIELLSNVFNFLLYGKNSEFSDTISFSRPFPDKIVFSPNRNINYGETLYFKENYYPSWIVYVQSGSKRTPLEIYSAGPTFMAVFLPQLSAGDKVVFEFKIPRQFYLGVFVSALSLIVLLLFMLDELILRGVLLQKVSIGVSYIGEKVSEPLFKRFKKVREDIAEEEDY